MKLIEKDDLENIAVYLFILIMIIAGGAVYVGFLIENYIVCGLGFLPFLILAIICLKTHLNLRYDASLQNQIINLKTKGDNVKINLGDIKVKSNSYSLEVEKGGGYNTRLEHIQVYRNYLSLTLNYRGHAIEWESEILMEPEILHMKLALQKETLLYIDMQTGNHYMDLDFLRAI